jgi:hypothetical protein
LLPLAWPSTEPDLSILYWGLLNNVPKTIGEVSQKIEHCINIRDADHFVFTVLWSGPSLNPSNQRVVIRRCPSGPPLTASRFHVEVSFPNCSLPSIHNPDNSRSASCQSCRIYNRRFLNKKNNKVYSLSWIT